MRRSTGVSLPLQLGFPASTYHNLAFPSNRSFWRENFGGKILAGKFWRENFGGKILAGKFWREQMFGLKFEFVSSLKFSDQF
jgi:hypothetical protein